LAFCSQKADQIAKHYAENRQNVSTCRSFFPPKTVQSRIRQPEDQPVLDRIRNELEKIQECLKRKWYIRQEVADFTGYFGALKPIIDSELESTFVYNKLHRAFIIDGDTSDTFRQRLDAFAKNWIKKR